MEIRLAGPDELDRIMELYDGARRIMRDSGNRNQWVNGYPQRALVAEDIRRSSCYVMAEGDRLHGVFALLEGAEPSYREIRGGAWLSDAPYGTIHRIGSAGTVRHFADVCFRWALDKCGNLRIDTHADNAIMRHVLERNGFQFCGHITLADGTPRLAFQKVRA